MQNTQTLQTEAIERIKLRLQQYGQNLDQVEQLCLDDIQITNFTPAIREQIQRCINCQYLTMNHCGIKSLEGFPTMFYVSALELIGNQITGKDLAHLQNCAKIQMLALDQNKIAHVQDFSHLNNLKEIQHLEIRGNPVCLIEDYRSKIFEISTKLKIIDCQDVFGDEDVMFGSETDEQNSDQLNNQQSNQKANEEQDQQIQQNQYQDQFKDYGSRKY